MKEFLVFLKKEKRWFMILAAIFLISFIAWTTLLSRPQPIVLPFVYHIF